MTEITNNIKFTINVLTILSKVVTFDSPFINLAQVYAKYLELFPGEPEPDIFDIETVLEESAKTGLALEENRKYTLNKRNPGNDVVIIFEEPRAEDY